MDGLPVSEICYVNMMDILTYPTRTVTLSAHWTTSQKSRLYDHSSVDQIVTVGDNSDASSSIITVDLGSAQYVGLVKVLNTNAKNLKIEYSSNGSSWTTWFNPITLSVSYYNAEVVSTTTNATQAYSTYSKEGLDTINTGSGTEYYLNYRYWRFTITATQVANQEKAIGEIYIGRRMVNFTANRYKQILQDDKEQLLKDYFGVPIYNTVKPIFQAEMTVNRPNLKTFNLMKAFIVYRNNFNFFPTSTVDASKVSYDVDADDIYLVTSRGTWPYTSWGSSPTNQVDLYLTETKFVY